MTSLADQWTTQLAERLKQGSGEPGWVNDLRRAGAKDFEKYGLPHRKVEDWKYTSLKLLEARSHRLVEEGRAPAAPQEEGWAGRWPKPLIDGEYPALRLLNGHLNSGFEKPGSVQIKTLEEALAEEDGFPWLQKMLESLEIDGPARAFSALNTSMLGPGLVVNVPADTDARSLFLQWAFDDTPPAMLFNTRVVIRVEEGASLNLIEQFESDASHAHGLNLVIQVQVGRDARFNHVRLQQESDEAAVIARTECDVGKNGRYVYHGFDWGGGLVRNDTRPRLLGEGAEAEVNGAFVLDGSRHFDHHVYVDHVSGDTTSRQFFRGVLGGHSRGVFNGKARICEGADGSNVQQSNANLLLSPMAEMDTKPELEIYADEVEASHGATVGQLDEDAVFYMRTRGLSDEQARAMLTIAFCKAVLERATNLPAPLGEQIGSRMESALGKLVGSRTAPSALPG